MLPVTRPLQLPQLYKSSYLFISECRLVNRKYRQITCGSGLCKRHSRRAPRRPYLVEGPQKGIIIFLLQKSLTHILYRAFTVSSPCNLSWNFEFISLLPLLSLGRRFSSQSSSQIFLIFYRPLSGPHVTTGRIATL